MLSASVLAALAHDVPADQRPRSDDVASTTSDLSDLSDAFMNNVSQLADLLSHSAYLHDGSDFYSEAGTNNARGMSPNSAMTPI